MSTELANDRSGIALVLIDVINHFEFPDGRRMLRNAMAIAPPLARLKQRARRAGVPSIYVNDNFGQWRSDAKSLVRYCLRPETPGCRFVTQLRPDSEDYFILKPMHSAFFQTPLEILLRHLGASSLIVCGLATNSCIICTVHDANMRGLGLYVPSDCSASRSAREHAQAIEHIRQMADARVGVSTGLSMEKLRRARSAIARSGPSAETQ